jgi:uncharacterized protein YyaL (SSP411 family)
MLYDNGLLLSLYCDAWQATENPLFLRIIQRIADWVQREMQSPEGGYYSSLDADSEGQEGRHYVWNRDEINSLLDKDEAELLGLKFGLDDEPNFEGHWHLHAEFDDSELADLSSLSVQQIIRLQNSAEKKLLSARDARVRPGCDTKVLTAWNALMIKGMARAARLLEQPEYRRSAERALAFIRGNLWRDGRLLASWRSGRAELNAYLDDYAFLLDALLEMLQLRWCNEDLNFAIEIADCLLNHFEDKERGGFFFTSDNHEALIHRPKPWTDDAMPSGNGVAAHALNRLGHLVSEPCFLEASHRVLKAAHAPLSQYPSANGALLLGLDEQLAPPELVIVKGEDAMRKQWMSKVTKDYVPHRLCFSIPENAAGPGAVAESSGLKTSGAIICRGTHCLAPVRELREFERILKTGEAI